MDEKLIINSCIRQVIKMGGVNIAIVPYGKYGKEVKNILNNEFGISETVIFDNYKANGKNIFSLNDLKENYTNYIYLLSAKGGNAFTLKKQLIKRGVLGKNIISIFQDSCLQDINNNKDMYGYKKDYVSWQEKFLESLKGLNIGEGAEVENSGEKELFSFVEKIKKVKCIFDVGANVGMYTDALNRHFPKAIIHSFEPGKTTFQDLKENVGDIPNVILNNLAVSDKLSEQILYYDKKGSGLASLHKRQLDYLNIDFNEEEIVKTVTLDRYCEDNCIESIDLLKMDIEGYEYKALCGAKKLLKEQRISIIQIEFGGCNIDSRTYFRDFWNLLHGDFKVYRIMKDGLVEISKYDETLEIFVTTNYVFINKNILNGISKNI